MSTVAVQPFLRMPAEEYHSKLALSHSGMKDLAVSPLRYWHLHVNPDRPARRDTPEMRFGTALHCLVLEGEKAFNQRFARAVDEADYPVCLVTMDDLRGWIRDKGFTPKGARKAEAIAQAQSIDPSVAIWDVLTAENERANADKMLCLKEDWERIWNTANALRNEPRLQEIIKEGEAEIALFADDHDTGVPLKARLDWLSPRGILDLKTFVTKRGKSVDQSVADAIFYECYYRQAYFYPKLHQQVAGAAKPAKYFIAFVESEEPHEVRIKDMRSSSHGVVNVWWQRAQIEVRHFTSMWAEYMREFGETRPWRREQEIEPLLDEEMKGMTYGV